MMSYDNYHFTTKVTTMHNADYELVGDNRNILLERTTSPGTYDGRARV